MQNAKTCEACGKPAAIGLGGVLLCRTCHADVRAEIDDLRAAGKQVDAMRIARRMYKEQHSAGDYLIRDFPAELKAKARHRAIDEKTSLRDIILKALEKYLG